jgi:hypothetical protein
MEEEEDDNKQETSRGLISRRPKRFVYPRLDAAAREYSKQLDVAAGAQRVWHAVLLAETGN